MKLIVFVLILFENKTFCFSERTDEFKKIVSEGIKTASVAVLNRLLNANHAGKNIYSLSENIKFDRDIDKELKNKDIKSNSNWLPLDTSDNSDIRITEVDNCGKKYCFLSQDTGKSYCVQHGFHMKDLIEAHDPNCKVSSSTFASLHALRGVVGQGVAHPIYNTCNGLMEPDTEMRDNKVNH